MKTKSRNELKKLHTKNTLHWYLQVGFSYGTLTVTQAIDVCRVDKITFNRWLKGQSAAPAATLELLRLHAYGEPPAGRSTAWRGFRFQNDVLITEDCRTLTPGDLKAVFFWRQMAFNGLDAAARREIYRELKAIYARA